MDKQQYVKPQVKDLGSIQDLTLGNVGGINSDSVRLLVPGIGRVLLTISGAPLPISGT